MGWHREWQAIEESISDFSDICSEFVSALNTNSSDTLGTIKTVILPMAKEIAIRLRALGGRYESQLPKIVLDKIDEEFFDQASLLLLSSTTTLKTATAVAHFSSKFRKFRSDFNYLTSDLEGTVVRLTARAFTHLQRSIIADTIIRDKWIDAKKEGEPACEKLGAVHLLLHGIWSFKVGSAGERTDLIVGEPLRDERLGEVYLTAEGLVLTEWKVATVSNSTRKYQEALSQTEYYGQGSLAAIELKRYRYLVIVSEDYLSDVPPDNEKNGIIYKYINIAVNPSTPSVQARKSSTLKT